MDLDAVYACSRPCISVVSRACRTMIYQYEAQGGLLRSEPQGGLSVSDRERPVFPRVNGTLMARRSWSWARLMTFRPSAFQAGRISS
jgi:hypothetical protein